MVNPRKLQRDNFYKNSPFSMLSLHGLLRTVQGLRMGDVIIVRQRRNVLKWSRVLICVPEFQSVLFRLSFDIPYQCSKSHYIFVLKIIFYKSYPPMLRVSVDKYPNVVNLWINNSIVLSSLEKKIHFSLTYSTLSSFLYDFKKIPPLDLKEALTDSFIQLL